MKIINQPPFEPTEIEAIAITNIGLMYAHILILLFMLILMLYCYKTKIRSYSIIIVIYMFSIIFGMSSLEYPHTPFSPMLEVFFLVIQTTIFIELAIKYISVKNRN